VLARAPEIRIVALTASTDEARMMGVLRAGAAGYVRKDAEPETLLAAVRTVARGRTFIDPSIGHRVLRTDTSDETVKTHVRHVLAKLGAENRAQAAVRALARGVVSPEDLAAD